MKNFIASYQKDCVYQAIIVQAETEEQAINFFHKDRKNAVLIGIHEKLNINEELKKGMPVIKA